MLKKTKDIIKSNKILFKPFINLGKIILITITIAMLIRSLTKITFPFQTIFIFQ